jgi:hypothetical protein
VHTGVADHAVIERFKNLGLEIVTTSPDEFRQILRADGDNGGQFVKKLCR